MSKKKTKEINHEDIYFHIKKSTIYRLLLRIVLFFVVGFCAISNVVSLSMLENLIGTSSEWFLWGGAVVSALCIFGWGYSVIILPDIILDIIREI